MVFVLIEVFVVVVFYLRLFFIRVFSFDYLIFVFKLSMMIILELFGSFVK